MSEYKVINLLMALLQLTGVLAVVINILAGQLVEVLPWLGVFLLSMVTVSYAGRLYKTGNMN